MSGGVVSIPRVPNPKSLAITAPALSCGNFKVCAMPVRGMDDDAMVQGFGGSDAICEARVLPDWAEEREPCLGKTS